MEPSRTACDETVREGFPVFFCVFVVLGGKAPEKRVGLTLRLEKLTVRKKSLRLKNFLTAGQTFGGTTHSKTRLDTRLDR